MKRLVIAVSVLFLSGLLFAAGNKEKKPYDISVGGSYNYISEEDTIDGQEIIARYNAFGLHLGVGGMLNSKWGVINNLGVYFPYNISGEIDGVKQTVDMSVYDYIFGMNILLGFPYYFQKNESLSFGIGPAIDMLTLMYETASIGAVGIYGGVGIVVDGKYQLKNATYISFGAYGVYNFYQSSTFKSGGTTVSSSGSTNSILIKPYLGIGYTFNKPE